MTSSWFSSLVGSVLAPTTSRLLFIRTEIRTSTQVMRFAIEIDARCTDLRALVDRQRRCGCQMKISCAEIQEIFERHVLEIRVDGPGRSVAHRDSRCQVVSNDCGCLREPIIDSAEKSRCACSLDHRVVIELRLSCLGDLDSRIEAGDIPLDHVVPDDPVIMRERRILIRIVRVFPVASTVPESKANPATAIDDRIVFDQRVA